MKNLIVRAISGAVFVGLVIASILVNHIFFSILFLIITILCLHEFYSNVKKSGIAVQGTLGTIIGALLFSIIATICIGSYKGLDDLFFLYSAIIPLLFVVFIVELWRKKANPFTNIAYTILGIAYIAVPLGAMNFLLNPEMEEGVYITSIVLGIFILSWTNDTFAYLTGILFGKRRLFERHSPKKSWEGFWGGFAFTILGAYLLYRFVPDTYLGLRDWIAIGIITSVIGTLGDLVESMFKRSLNVKDSGTIMPGHGGILDRLDGIIIVIPFIFCYLTFFKGFFSL